MDSHSGSIEAGVDPEKGENRSERRPAVVPEVVAVDHENLLAGELLEVLLEL